MRVLVLCHGNINRSPLCAAILTRHYPELDVRQAALKSLREGWKPERAAKKMRDAALELGYDLEAHRSQPLTKELFHWAQCIVYMDNGNLRRLESFVAGEEPPKGQRWVSLGNYAIPPVERIPDPAFMRRGSPEFEDTVLLIRQGTHNLAQGLIAE